MYWDELKHMKQTIPNVCALVRTYFVCVVCFIVRFRHVDIVIYSLFISKFTSTLSSAWQKLMLQTR